MHLPQLRRVRWAVRAALTLGVAASVAANILHALPNPISQAIAAWPPLALLLTVELISRVPMHRRALATARLAATAAIAGIAAWVSYWHMAGVAARYGESGSSAYLLPFSVDGLIVVASVSLVELAGRIRELEREAQVEATAPAIRTATPQPGTRPASATTEATPPVDAPAAKPATRPSSRSRSSRSGTATGTGRADAPPARRPRRPAAETAALAAAYEAMHPDATPADIAAELGISTKRLQAIRREFGEVPQTA
ncbi:MAG TPA: DUF2637 domain-containing protein [Micromonosporaceae bacterium]